MLGLCCVYVSTRAKFIQYIKELGVASSLTYRGIVTFFFKDLPPNFHFGAVSSPPFLSCTMLRVYGVTNSQSHHLFVIPVIVENGRCCERDSNPRSGVAGRWTSKMLAQLYIYEKLR